MQVCTVLKKRDGCVVGADLGCSVREQNVSQKESYSADWHSINMRTQDEER